MLMKFFSPLLRKLYLLATWPQLTDQMVVDSQSYTDLEPMQAPLWAIQIEMGRSREPPQLSQCVASLCNLSMNSLHPCKWLIDLTLFSMYIIYVTSVINDMHVLNSNFSLPNQSKTEPLAECTHRV